MTFDIPREAEPHTGGSAFEPLTGAASRVKKSLRSRSGGLLTSTALVSVGFAFVAGSAAAQVPAGYAPAPAEVVSYVQLSNGSVLVQLANNQSLLVTSNNYFIDNAGVLYLSPSVGGNISGGAAPAAPAPLVGALPMASNQAPPSSTGVLFDDTAVAANSGGMMSAVTGGPGLFGLGTLGTIAAVAVGTGALVLGVNAIRSRLEDDDTSNTAAGVTVVDDDIVRGETGGSIAYTIADADGLDQSELQTAVENAVGGASTVASIFPNGATVVVEGAADSLVDGTTDTYASLSVTVTGDIAAALNVGSFPGPSVAFTDAKGNAESVNFALDIAAEDGGSTGSLELDQADGSTHEIAQGGSKLFSATDPEGDTVTYGISNNPSGIGIDSNTGLVVVASSVATGSYTITVTASSTGADGTVDTDTETYNITVTEGAGGSGGSGGNVVNADFDSSNAGFNTLTGVNITDGDTTDSGDNEFEVAAASHLANSFIMDGLAGDDTVYFSEAGATYHLDPTWVNGFEDVSGFETLELLSNVDLEINGGVLDSVSTGDIEHIKGSGDNMIKLVNNDADMGLDVTLTNIDTIDMNNYDLTLDHSDLSQIKTIKGDTQSTIVFSGQFTYDFADGLISTADVTRIGLDAGNYTYNLTLDGVHDEDVREIYAYGSNEIEGDVLIDARENSKITLIDLAGDTYTTGGIDGDSNIFVTYDDRLTILGGENDDDVDLILDSDIEDGEFQFDGGGDDEDTLNVNLNGDEIDTRGYGRSIDHVEYIDIDAPDGDGEAHLQFDGSSTDKSDIVHVDMSDVSEDSSITLDGDLSADLAYAPANVTQTGSSVSAAAYNHDDASGATSSHVTAAIAAVEDAGTAEGATAEVLVEGFVGDSDVEVIMTAGDDTIDLTVGETEFNLTLQDVNSVAGVAATHYGLLNALDFSALGAVGTGLVVAGAGTAAATANSIYVETAVVDTSSSIAKGSEEVTVHLGGGDDKVNLVLGAAQIEDVTLKFSRADTDDHDTVDINELEDLSVLAGNASGLRLDFADDISTIINAGAADAAAVNVASSQQNAVLVFDGGAQEGFIVDRDGDGKLSDGDIHVDLTDAVSAVSFTDASTFTATSTQGDTFTFALSGGDLIDIA